MRSTWYWAWRIRGLWCSNFKKLGSPTSTLASLAWRNSTHIGSVDDVPPTSELGETQRHGSVRVMGLHVPARRTMSLREGLGKGLETMPLSHECGSVASAATVPTLQCPGSTRLWELQKSASPAATEIGRQELPGMSTNSPRRNPLRRNIEQFLRSPQTLKLALDIP